MADYNIRFKDKDGNFLYPQVKSSNIIGPEGSFIDFSEFVTEDRLGEAIANVESLHVRVVAELPLVSEAKQNTLYLVASNGAVSGNLFFEYLLVEKEGQKEWEMVGSAGIDLSNYVTISILDTRLSNYVTKESLTITLASYVKSSEVYSKTEVDQMIADVEDLVSQSDISYEIIS